MPQNFNDIDYDFQFMSKVVKLAACCTKGAIIDDFLFQLAVQRLTPWVPGQWIWFLFYLRPAWPVLSNTPVQLKCCILFDQKEKK